MKSSIVGGDYAGLSATFSSKSGELIPVPQHLIPQSMLEWGDIPSCLEVLTSEDWIGVDDNDRDDGKSGDDDQHQLVRTIITVLPEVGCGIDNLEVTKRSETFLQYSDRLDCWKYGNHLEREVVVADRHRKNQEHILDVETIFQVDSDADEDGNQLRRIRISFSLDLTRLTEEASSSSSISNDLLSNIITFNVERQHSSQSTQGTMWSGPSYNSGGLDARTVMTTIGKSIMNGDVFGVKRMGKGGDSGRDPWVFPNRIMEKDEDGEMSILEGRWTKTTTTDAGAEEVHRTKQDFEPMDTSTMVKIRLPQNILLRYGRSSSDHNIWNIEVSHIESTTKNSKIHLHRSVVSRSFDQKESVSQIGQNKRLGDVIHWVEHKNMNN